MTSGTRNSPTLLFLAALIGLSLACARTSMNSTRVVDDGSKLPAPQLVLIQDYDVGADPLAEAFGARPWLWGVRLSPDGSRISYLQVHSSDTPIAVVLDTRSGKSNVLLASDKGRFDIKWCRWASNERLLCGFTAMAKELGQVYPVTRLVAVDADGSKRKELLQKKLRDVRTQFQDDIVDWLPDDLDHVLIEMPDQKGTGVVELDIHKGTTNRRTRNRTHVHEWKSDGRGELRLRMSTSNHKTSWSYTLAGERKWRQLHESPATEIFSNYYPVGFGENSNRLLVFKPSENRLALWSEDLANDRKSQVIFEHPEADVDSVMRIGKYDRIVAVSYSTDRPHLHFFDAAVKRVTERVSGAFPGQLVQVVDESWNRRMYLIHVSSDQNPGVFHLFDDSEGRLTLLSPQYPKLEGQRLASMKSIYYDTRDGVQIPGYLTSPDHVPESELPAVILPHGGPHSRDHWGYDWLAHYFAARGYAVLQSNYRGSGGFGADWLGEGAYRNWRRAIDDIDDGLQHLINEGVVDPSRVCIVGWSYGGYAALMSAAVYPDRYRCVVSIAGVTDLDRLKRDWAKWVGGRRFKAYVGSDPAVLIDGSPVKQAADFQAPVLLFHGDLDINVSVAHSKAMEKALKRKKKAVEYVEYEDVEHSILNDEYRIDMLTRIGTLLDETTRPRAPETEP